MIPSAARAAERLFGTALVPAAGAARALAWAALAGVAILLVARGVRAVREGASLSAAANVLLAGAIAAAASACRIGDASAPPLPALAGAAGFLFVAAAAAAAARAASSAPRGAPARVLAAAAAAVLLVPAGAGIALSHALDPPPPRVIGSLWTTPTALYVAETGRARREGASCSEISAEIVTARSPLFGVTWTGLARLSAAGASFPWRGRGGRAARLVDRFGPGPGRGGGWLTVERSRVSVATPPNVPVWILRSPSGVTFTPAGAANDPDLSSR